ncbi:hypothetical protein DFJ74DRAFT_705243 [Hyaloraphidium curvatum]|nr:hypothetical protein DFJ74DRAFT_705243 [Hyaloraphidium curvatum]
MDASLRRTMSLWLVPRRPVEVQVWSAEVPRREPAPPPIPMPLGPAEPPSAAAEVPKEKNGEENGAEKWAAGDAVKEEGKEEPADGEGKKKKDKGKKKEKEAAEGKTEDAKGPEEGGEKHKKAKKAKEGKEAPAEEAAEPAAAEKANEEPASEESEAEEPTAEAKPAEEGKKKKDKDKEDKTPRFPNGKTVILIRHGEKPAPEDDVWGNLTDAGWARADFLADLLTPSDGVVKCVPPLRLPTGPLKHIYAPAPTDEKTGRRMQQTVGPLAKRLGIPPDERFPADDPAGLAETAATEFPEREQGTVLACYPHAAIVAIAGMLMSPEGAALGMDGRGTPLRWDAEDFDSLWAVRDGRLSIHAQAFDADAWKAGTDPRKKAGGAGEREGLLRRMTSWVVGEIPSPTPSPGAAKQDKQPAAPASDAPPTASPSPAAPAAASAIAVAVVAATPPPPGTTPPPPPVAAAAALLVPGAAPAYADADDDTLLPIEPGVHDPPSRGSPRRTSTSSSLAPPAATETTGLLAVPGEEPRPKKKKDKHGKKNKKAKTLTRTDSPRIAGEQGTGKGEADPARGGICCGLCVIL